MTKLPELLLPAKDLETLRLAIGFGADAVYIGGQAFGLRAGATNFSYEDMKAGTDYAHACNKKIYVTANIIARNRHIGEVDKYFKELRDIGVDGVLVADPGMYRVLKRVWPDAPVHISTQAGNSNYETFMFWYDLGVRRLVCERLLTLDEIGDIRRNIPDDMEIEAFVHGAMCISFSGRCLLSATLTGRDANLGECTHPCRWKYHLVEEKRPGEYFPITEDEQGTYIMNSRDMCMVDRLPQLIEAGIDSLKIEGRMKSPLYVASMARTYRKALEDLARDPKLYEANIDSYIRNVCETTHRPYSHGFYYGDEGKDAIVSEESTYVVEYTYLGYVEDITGDGYAVIHQKNKFLLGDTIELMKPNGDNISTRVLDIKDEAGNSCEGAPHPKQLLYISLDCEFEINDILRCLPQKGAV